VLTIDLAGQVVVITGAAGGVGSGIAQRFSEAGASLVLQHYRSDAPSWSNAVAVRADLTSGSGPGAVIDAAMDTFGRVDALVNNAGIQPVAAFLDVTDDDFRTMLDTNVTAAHRLTQAFARVTDHGSVVHLASIEGTHAALQHSHYSVSKAALLMHMRAAAIELGPRIRVNAVSPGLVHRDGIEERWPDGVGRWTRNAPLARLGRSAEIGDACVFLVSSMASWVTGANLVVDGGMSARPMW
jgi:NAD(P)-dependent dehydrogenase (short-subunit alcohol dehydrogenase family)